MASLLIVVLSLDLCSLELDNLMQQLLCCVSLFVLGGFYMVGGNFVEC